ncbi:MAG: dimethylargininase [Myxococcota bacterium]
MVSLPADPATPQRAWVRAPSDAYARCLRADDTITPDVDRALEQHGGYVAALRAAGVEVEILPPVAGLPDACFVEDVAVILDPEFAVLTRPGAVPRQSESATIEPRLAEIFAMGQIQAPATLDGGDVLRLGARLLVGSSRRTNEAGIEQLRGLAAPRGLDVLGIPVTAGLHLKSACTALDLTTVLVDPTALDPGPLRDLGLRVHAVPEPVGANVLTLGDRVLVSAAAPKTARWLESRGRAVVRISLGEFHRGDGALSCLSLRQAAPGSWVV